MDHWIEAIGETSRLILAWQAPYEVQDRVRWAIGELSMTSDGVQFRYFQGDELSRLNDGRTQDDLRSAGYLGYPAFDPRPGAPPVFHEGVLEAFMRRLPPPKRADYPKYLEHFRLRSVDRASPFSLLAITEARLPSDGFSLIDPLDPVEPNRDVVIEVAGHRRNVTNRDHLFVGQPLQLAADPENPHDPSAVRIEAGGQLIGHVNRLQAPTIGRWLRERDLSAWLQRLNGTAEAPRAFAFLQMRSRAGRKAA